VEYGNILKRKSHTEQMETAIFADKSKRYIYFNKIDLSKQNEKMRTAITGCKRKKNLKLKPKVMARI